MRSMRRAGAAAAAALALLLPGCGGGGVTGGDGTGRAAAGATREQAVGWASVRYPADWTVLAPGDRPQGWAWAAQDRPDGEHATAQLAVDGELSQYPDIELSLANLLAAAQMGALPGFELREKVPAEVDGAEQALRADFRYEAGGKDHEGVWVVARAADHRTVAVQVTGRAPLGDRLVRDTIAGLRMTGAPA